jgi:hypothetical protein
MSTARIIADRVHLIDAWIVSYLDLCNSHTSIPQYAFHLLLNKHLHLTRSAHRTLHIWFDHRPVDWAVSRNCTHSSHTKRTFPSQNHCSQGKFSKRQSAPLYDDTHKGCNGGGYGCNCYVRMCGARICAHRHISNCHNIRSSSGSSSCRTDHNGFLMLFLDSSSFLF